MRIIFFGTPPFAAYILEHIHTSHEVVAVICPPDKEQGRGRKLESCAVKLKSETLEIPFFQPENLNDSSFLNTIISFHADLFVVVAFRKLPKELWSIAKKGCINLHTSLLPNYKGAAPINWVLINGEKQTGITTFFINETIDSGNIILQEKVELSEETTAAQLHNLLMEKGCELMLETIQKITKNLVEEKIQPDNKSLLIAPKLDKELLKIEWENSAQQIHNLVRGLSPFLNNETQLKDVAICPSAWFWLKIKEKNIRVKLIQSNYLVQPHHLAIGTILTDNKSFMKIAVNDGYISILWLQMEGKKSMDIKSFLVGFQITKDYSAN